MTPFLTIVISSATAAIINFLVWFVSVRRIQKMDQRIEHQDKKISEFEEQRLAKLEAAILGGGKESRESRKRVYQYADQTYVRKDYFSAVCANNEERVHQLEATIGDIKSDLDAIRTTNSESAAIVKLIASRLNINIGAN